MDLKIKIDLSGFDGDNDSLKNSNNFCNNYSEDGNQASNSSSNDILHNVSTHSNSINLEQPTNVENFGNEDKSKFLKKKVKNPVSFNSELKNGSTIPSRAHGYSSKKKIGSSFKRKKLVGGGSSSHHIKGRNPTSLLSLSGTQTNSLNNSLQCNHQKTKARHWEEKWVLYPNVFEFTKEIWLKKWVLVDGGDDYEPNVCPQSFYPKYIKTLKEISQRKYTCSFENCGKIFYDSSSFRKHQQTHGEKHYICTYENCGKKFLDNSKLKRHQLVHTGEKQFRCDLCGKRFSLDFNLKTHLRTHTGEKPYICPYPGCEKRFTQSSNLTAHEKTHKEPSSKDKESKIGDNLSTSTNKI